MATLSEIAEKCGVSTATVSYVLSGKGEEKRISPAMQELVRATAEQLGYKQRTAGASAPAQTRVAVFWPQRSIETTLLSVINGVNTAACLDPIPVSITICPYESNHLADQPALWSTKEFDAALVISANSDDLTALRTTPTRIPTVIVNRSAPNYPCVTVDHVETGRIAALHALCKGGDSVGLVLNPASYEGMNLRANAFFRTCGEYGVDISRNVFYCDNTIDAGYELGVSMIRENHVPKVITCIYDIVSFGMLRALVEAGINVGEEVQLLATGTSLSSFFSRCTPPMTMVEMHLEEVTQRAMRVAVELAARRIGSDTEIVLHPNIIYRASSPAPTFVERQALEKRRTGAL